MLCPRCKTKLSFHVVFAHLKLASDASFITSEVKCLQCGNKMELYYPLKDITEV